MAADSHCSTHSSASVSLRSLLQPEIPWVTPDTPLLEVAQTLAGTAAGAVVVVAGQGNQQPLGMVTIGDLLVAQAQGLSPERTAVARVMGPPPAWVGVGTDLATAIAQCQTHQKRPLLVVETGVDDLETQNPRQNCPWGPVVGLLTWQRMALGQEVAKLHQANQDLLAKVARLEAENLALLEDRATALENQVAQQAADLAAKAQQEMLLAKLATQIRSSLNLSEILAVATADLQRVLRCQRIAIYQFKPQEGHVLLGEAPLGDGPLPRIVTPVELSPQAMRVPIWVQKRLWGLLLMEHSLSASQWYPRFQELVRQVTLQLSVAIQQVNAYGRIRRELESRQAIETRLRESQRQCHTLATLISVGVVHLTMTGQCSYINAQGCRLLGAATEAVLGTPWHQWVAGGERGRIWRQWRRCQMRDQPFRVEYSFQRQDGTVVWVDAQVVAERESDGGLIGYVGTLTDISDRRQARQDLQCQRDLSRLVAELNGRFVDIAATDLAETIQVALAQLGQQCKVDWCALLRVAEDLESRQDAPSPRLPTLVVSHGPACPDPDQYPAYPEQWSGEQVPWAIARLMERQVVAVPAVAALPPEATVDQRHWQGLGAEGVLWVPLVQQSQVVGCLAMVRRRPSGLWPEAVIEAAEILGQTILATQERIATAAILCAQNTQSQAILAAIPDLMMQVSGDGIYQSLICQRPAIDFFDRAFNRIGRSIWDCLDPAVAERHAQGIRAALETGQLQCYEQDVQVGDRLQHEEVRIMKAGPNQVLMMIRDISDRHRAEQMVQALNQSLEEQVRRRTAALYQSEAKLQAMVNAIPDLLLRVRVDGTCLNYVHSPDSPGHFLPIRYHLSEVLPPHLLAQQLTAIRRAIETQTLQVYEHHFKKGSELIYEEVRISHIDDNEALIIVRDISDRKRAELKLRASERKFRRIVEQANDIIYALSDEGIFLYVSPQWTKILGHELSDVLNHSFVPFVHPEDVPKCQDYLISTIRDHISYGDVEYRVRHRDGSWRWHMSNVSPEFDDAGNFIAVWGIARDITEKKEAEIALRESQQFLALMLDTFPLGVFWKDRNSVYLGCNQYFADFYGLESPSQVLGHTVFDFHSQPLEAQGYYIDDQEVISSGQAKRNIEERISTAMGEVRWVETNKLPLRDLEGNILGVVGTFQDITERKQAEMELQRTNQELARVTRLKDQFLANMSHELRTPLNAILGMTEGLQDEIFGPITPGQLNALNTIERSGSHLLELINDILDLAKIESGTLKLNLESLSMTQVCQQSLSLIQPLAHKKNIDLQVILPDLPATLGDERRLRQVLINLLNNAIKFTPEGNSITLEASVVPQSEFKGSEKPGIGTTGKVPLAVKVVVRDTGIGISAEDQTRLFQPFVQVDSSLNRQYQGTGLGLALVKQIMELHGGWVQLESVLGQGSCFTLALPTIVSASASEVAHPPAPPTLVANPLPTTRTVLLLESRDTVIQSISSYLVARGYGVRVGRTLAEGTHYTQANPCDLVLIDGTLLPPLEAQGAALQPFQALGVPLIAMVEPGSGGDRRPSNLSPTIHRWINRPIKLKRLFILMEECFSLETP